MFAERKEPGRVSSEPRGSWPWPGRRRAVSQWLYRAELAGRKGRKRLAENQPRLQGETPTQSSGLGLQMQQRSGAGRQQNRDKREAKAGATGQLGRKELA